MAVPYDVEEFVEKHIKLMISQTETYLPFIRVAFPYSNNIADGVYNLIIGLILWEKLTINTKLYNNTGLFLG